MTVWEKNLQNHLMTCMVDDLADGQTSLDMLTDSRALHEAVEQFQTGNGGPLANGGDDICFVPVAHVATAAKMQRAREYGLRQYTRDDKAIAIHAKDLGRKTSR
jgi:hypothetical protein